MINEIEFLNCCKSKGLKAFKVLTELDDTDILLDTEDINVFFDVCKCYDVEFIFYSYAELKEKDYILNKEIIMKSIQETINKEKTIRNADSFNFDSNAISYNRFAPPKFDDDSLNLDHLLDKYNTKVDKIIENQNELKEHYEWDTPLMLEAFIATCTGDRIGIILYNEDEPDPDNELYWNDKLIQVLIKELEEEITILVNENSMNQAEIYEKECEEENNRKLNALAELESDLQTDDLLMDCTNGTMRNAYAKELVNKYSKRYECNIFINEVTALVEKEYKKRKNKSK